MVSNNRVKTETEITNVITSKSPSKGIVKELQMELEPFELLPYR